MSVGFCHRYGGSVGGQPPHLLFVRFVLPCLAQPMRRGRIRRIDGYKCRSTMATGKLVLRDIAFAPSLLSSSVGSAPFHIHQRVYAAAPLSVRFEIFVFMAELKLI